MNFNSKLIKSRNFVRISNTFPGWSENIYIFFNFELIFYHLTFAIK